MARVTFPTSRSLNQTITTNNVSYKWDGRKWKKLAVEALDIAAVSGVTAKVEEVVDSDLVKTVLSDASGVPDAVISVSTANSSVYKFTGDGFPSESGNNPDFYFERGKTYIINNTSSASHPLQIRVSDGGSAYSTGVTANGTSQVTFTVPMDAPDSLVYQCTSHAAMVGNIYVTGKAIKGYAIEVVSSLPGSPDANTIYFVTG
mgnify:CR=1 FL=1